MIQDWSRPFRGREAGLLAFGIAGCRAFPLLRIVFSVDMRRTCLWLPAYTVPHHYFFCKRMMPFRHHQATGLQKIEHFGFVSVSCLSSETCRIWMTRPDAVANLRHETSQSHKDMALDLRQLRYFREVANAQNFRAAAQRLNISQSSLSRRVADLEASLGVTLLHRDARGVKLTVPGHTLLARADALLDQFAILEKDIARDSRLSGRVTVGTSDSVSRLLLAPLAAAFEGPQNGIQLSFVEGAQYVLFEGLEAGRVDLAVMTTPDPISTCKMDPILLEPLYFIARYADRPRRKPISIVDVASYPLIMFPRPSGHRNYLEHRARQDGVNLVCRYEVSTTAVQKEFVMAGLANCILPLSAVHNDLGRRGLSATPIKGLALTRTLVWRTDRRQSAATLEVADAIRKIMLERRAKGAEPYAEASANAF